jgi:hypothetical protein
MSTAPILILPALLLVYSAAGPMRTLGRAKLHAKFLNWKKAKAKEVQRCLMPFDTDQSSLLPSISFLINSISHGLSSHLTR